MGLIGRGVVFTIGTISNAVLFIFLSRVILPLLETGVDVGGQGPATGAFNLLPMALQLAIGGLQVGLIIYFLSGIGEERSATRRPMP